MPKPKPSNENRPRAGDRGQGNVERHALFWAGALLALVAFIFVFREILLPFVVGMTLAYVLNPIADWLEARGVRRAIAATLIVGLAVLVLIAALLTVVPLAAEQARQFAMSLPTKLNEARAAADAWATTTFGTHMPAIRAAIEKGLGDAGGPVFSGAATILAGFLSRSLALVNILSLLLITPLVFFYLLLDWHRIVDTVHHWLPRQHVGTISRLARKIDLKTAAFLRGQGTVCLLLGALYAIGLTWVGIDYGALVGIATGLMAFVPIVGWALGLITALGLAIAKFGLAIGPLALVIGVLIAGLVLDTAVLSPKLVGEKLGIHPVWLIFALFAFSYLLGFVGTLVAVPLAAATGVLLRHGLDLYLKSDIYKGQP
jgi:predicted PurR-regulated permease PerM